MAFLSSDELSALQVQMAHDAEVAARPPEPSYPLAPTYVSSPETAAPATTYPLAPTITAPPAPDTSAYGPISPYVTPETAPGEYGTNPYTPPVTDKWGNPQITLSDGTTTWSNNIGQIWDSATQSWVDSTAPTALGNYYGAVQDAPSYSDISQARTAWENAPNPTNGSRFDRLGFQEAPTNRELVDFYRDLPQPADTDYGPGKFALNYGGGQDEFLGAPQQTIGAAPREPFFGSRGFYRDEGGDNAAFGVGGLTGLARRGLDAATVAGNIGAYVNPVTQPAAIARVAAGNNPFLDPFDRQQSILDTAGTAATDLASGNALVKDLGGPDLSNLPYGLNYVTDAALAPATLLTAGAGSEAPIIGSVFKGGLGKRLLGETAVGAGTLFGGEKAAEKAAEYTDNPYLIGGAGVLGGAVTGLGVLGGIKAAERALPAAGRAAAEAGLTPRNILEGEYGGSHAVRGNAPEFIPRTSVNEDPDFVSGTRKILDATTAEANIRRVGTAEREIRSGRSEQFGNIARTLNAGEGDAADTLTAARQSAAVGPLRKTAASPIDLTPGEKNAILSDIIDRVRNDELPPWAIFNATGEDSALEKLIAGQGLQPAEIKWVRQTFGDEVADAVKERPITAAQMAKNDLQEQIRSREYSDRAIARQEQAAADELARQNREVAARQETSDRAIQRTRWKNIARTNSAEDIQQRLADPFLTAEERVIAQKAVTAEMARAQNAAGRAVDAIWERARKANPDAEDLRRRADSLIDKKVTDPRTNAEIKKTIALWESGNRVILDGIGENRVQEVAGSIGRMLSGDVSDSHLAALIHRRSYLQSAFEQGGMDPAIAKNAANTLLERELKIRYPNGTPDNITEMLQSTKSLPYGAQGAISGAASISQKMKNSQFGIGDMAVFGQQVLKAITTGGVNLTTGLVNDMLTLLHLPHVRTLYAEGNLPKMIQYQLDGVAQGVSTGITDLSHEGTFISWFGRAGRFADTKGFVPMIRAMTDFQFKTVLGTLRNLNHEGNLVLLKLGGQDINNPAVRAQAAAFANANTSYWAPAQKSARAQTEKALLLSPPMRRAQIAQIRQVTKLIDGNGPERILAAATMASFGVSLLAIGKLVNDYVGIADFEFDPSKPGFGSITVPNPSGGKNLVISLFPQEQVATAFAKAVRVLAENPDKAGSLDAAKEIGKLLLSSSSPPARIAEAAGGFGYDPQENRYKFGNLNDNKSWLERVMNMAPIPPAATDVINQGLDAARTPLGFAGFNAYTESDYQPRDRKAVELFGKPYRDLPPTAATNGVYDPTKPSQRAVDEANGGKLESTFPETIARNKVIEDNRAANVATQQQIDSKYIKPGAVAPAGYDEGKAWREAKKTLDYAIREQWKTLEKAMPYTGPESTNPMRIAMNEWGAAMDAAKNGVETDFDQVDKWRAANPDKAKLVDEYMAGKVNTDLTPAVTAKNEASKKLGDAGFFDLRDDLWKAINAQSPAPGYVPGQGYYDWRAAQIERVTQEMIASGIPPATAPTKAETYIDTKFAPVSKFNDYYKTTILYPWVNANPELAETAVQWGYLYPDTKIQKFFQFRSGR